MYYELFFFYILTLVFTVFVAAAWICELADICDDLVLYAKLTVQPLTYLAVTMGITIYLYLNLEFNALIFHILYFLWGFQICRKIRDASVDIWFVKRCYLLYEIRVMQQGGVLSLETLRRFLNEVLIPQFPNCTEEIIRYFVKKCSKHAAENGLTWGDQK